jgi:uncharacterized protein (TIGR02147 family)
MTNIFDYDDYRSFLRKAYEERKAHDGKFTHRFIERRAGLKSSGHFAQIIQGKVNISTSLIGRFAEVFSLKKREADYFECLVLYTQGKTHEEKKRYFEKMIAFREINFRMFNSDQYQFFQKWYYTAIHVLLDTLRFRGDYKALGRKLSPPISAEQAQEAVELMVRLGLVRKQADGSWSRSDEVLSTGYDAESIALQNFQLEMMDVARGAMDRFPRTSRNFSTLTLSLTAESHAAIQEELRAFRRRVLEIARKTRNADTVYQYNFQVFPLALPGEKSPA